MPTAPLTRPAPMPTDSATPTMRAVAQERYGDAGEVLHLAELPLPTPANGQVRIRVLAAGVDRGTWHLVAGLPYLVRLAGYGVRRPTQPVPGLDVAGIVDEVGSGVEGFAPGDEVFGIATGAFAEYAVADAAKLAIKPAGVTFEEAAAVPVSGLAALQAVRDHGEVRPGQHVLVVGASGGVGSFAVQIAKAMGADVTGVASGAKADVVRAAGADHVIDYTSEDFADGDRRYDVIIDTGGTRRIRDLRRALTERGRLVIVGGEGGGRWLGGIDRQVRATLLSPFVRQVLRMFISSENAADLVALRELIDAGQVRALVERTFGLDEAAAAIDHLEAGRARGKIVLAVGAPSPT